MSAADDTGRPLIATTTSPGLKSGSSQHRAIVARLQDKAGDPATFVARRKADGFLQGFGR